MDSIIDSGPYRATRLWNQMVRTFSCGMPLKKHRHHMKIYEYCFSGLEAVKWFHSVLQKNPNVGPETTKDQTIQLLNKFLIAGVFRNVTNAPGSQRFKENGDIYQFCSKAVPNRSPRIPLSSTSLNIPIEYRRNDQYVIPSNNGLDENSANLNMKQNRATNMHHDREMNKGQINMTGVDFRPANITRLSRAYSSGRENVPANSQDRFVCKDPNAYNTMKTNPSSGSRTYRSSLPADSYPECSKTHLNTTGYGQHQNFYSTIPQYDLSSHTSHGQRNIPLKSPNQMSAQHKQENMHLKSSQHEMRYGNIQDSHPVTAQHDYFKSSLHGNVYSQYHNFSSSSNPNGVDKKSAYVKDCSQNNEIKSDFMVQNANFSTHNKVGLPYIHMSQHEPNYNRETRYLIQSKHGVDSNQSKHLLWGETSDSVKGNVQQKLLSTNTAGQCNIPKAPLSSEKMDHHQSYSQNRPSSKQFSDSNSAVTQCQLKTCSLTPHESQVLKLEDIWKSIVISRLQQLLDGIDVSAMVPKSLPSEWIYVNGTQPEGLLSQLPQQCLSVLDYLVYEHQEIPKSAIYMIKDYFCNLSEPLTTFGLYSTIAQLFLYVECVNNVYHSRLLDYKDIPPSKSTENLVLGMASPCPNISKPSLDEELSSSYDNLISGSMLLSTVLPPYSCFETAFTSDNPVTRIVPQRTMDSLHFKRNVPTSMSARPIKSVDHCTRKSRERRPSLHSGIPLDTGPTLKRNASAPNLLDVPNVTRSKSIRARVSRATSKRCTIKEKYGGQSGEIQEMRSQNKEEESLHWLQNSGEQVNPALSLDDVTQIVPQRTIDALRVPTSMNIRPVQLHSQKTCEPHQFSYSRTSPSPRPTLKRHETDPNLLEVADWSHSRSTRTQGTRANTKRSAIKKRFGWHSSKKEQETNCQDREEGGLEHLRNKSGGYVNYALALDDAEPELDYAAALENLNKLMQCSSNAHEARNYCVDSSSDSSSSYYTAASSSTFSSCQMLADSSVNNSTEYVDGEQWTQNGEQLGVATLQLLLLMIPPFNRTQLHVLLRFLNHLSSGNCYSPWNAAEIATLFYQSILCSRNDAEFDSALACRIVRFLVTHHEAVMQSPPELQYQVQQEEKLMKQQLSKTHPTYCEQVSCQQFEQQRLTGSQLALSELLDQILADRRMGLKEKKKRIKMFKESYPHIYKRRFPDSSTQEKRVVEKPRSLLHFTTLGRLMSLRV